MDLTLLSLGTAGLLSISTVSGFLLRKAVKPHHPPCSPQAAMGPQVHTSLTTDTTQQAGALGFHEDPLGPTSLAIHTRDNRTANWSTKDSHSEELKP